MLTQGRGNCRLTAVLSSVEETVNKLRSLSLYTISPGLSRRIPGRGAFPQSWWIGTQAPVLGKEGPGCVSRLGEIGLKDGSRIVTRPALSRVDLGKAENRESAVRGPNHYRTQEPGATLHKICVYCQGFTAAHTRNALTPTLYRDATYAAKGKGDNWCPRRDHWLS